MSRKKERKGRSEGGIASDRGGPPAAWKNTTSPSRPGFMLSPAKRPATHFAPDPPPPALHPWYFPNSLPSVSLTLL